MAVQTVNEVIDQLMNDSFIGNRIYLLGTAEFGPTNEPIEIRSEQALLRKFGNKGSLITAYRSLKISGTSGSVYLVKTTGTHSTLHLNLNDFKGEIYKQHLILTAKCSNELYDNIHVELTREECIFHFPNELRLYDRVYRYEDYKTIGSLVFAINNDTKRNQNYVYATLLGEAQIETKYALYPVNPNDNYFYGGSSGLYENKNVLYTSLMRTYEILEGQEIDLILPVDANLDDVFPDITETHPYGEQYYLQQKDYLLTPNGEPKRSFLDQLINFCLIQNANGIVTTGIMGYEPTAKIRFYLGEDDEELKRKQLCLSYNLSLCLNPFYSFLVSVVGFDLRYCSSLSFIENGKYAYASLCARTKVIDAITNVPFPTTIQLCQELTENALKQAEESGLVTFRQSPFYEQVVVYDARTASMEQEELKNYCNLRMIQLAICYLRRVYDCFIGEDLILMIEEKTLEQAIDRVLNQLKKKNILKKYSFTVVPCYYKSDVKVYLSLETVYMLKPFVLSSSINANQKGDGLYDPTR